MKPELAVETVTASQVRQQLGRILSRVSRHEARAIIEEGGIPLAAIVSTQDLERLNRYDQERAERFAVVDRMREAFKDVDPSEIEREVEAALAEVRAANWDEQRRNSA